MAEHISRWPAGRPSSPEGALCRLVALVLALAALMLAVPATPAAAQDATGAIEVHVSACPPGYDGADAFADCHANGLAGVNVLLSGGAADAKTTEGGTGAVRFDGIPAGAYTITLDLPDTGQSYRTYCSLEGEDTRVPVSPENANPTSLELGDGQAVICDVYVIPPADAPAETPTTEVPEAEAEMLASVTVNPVACPEGTDPEAGFDALAAACTLPPGDLTFTSGDAAGTIETTGTDDAGRVVVDGIEPGTYTLYSDVPLDTATEALFCVADDGNRYRKTFDDTGVTTFEDIQREQIVCDWFIVPVGDDDPTDNAVETPTPGAAAPTQPPPDSEEQRGVESGGSLVVHLALCPVEYPGDDPYGDCHGEGISDQEFVLTGPDGELHATTTVPQTPGPGLVEFTGLPAGDYTLMGGPPGDFGSVTLYCTTQPDGARVDAAVDSTVAAFALGEGEDVLCDWYYIPVNARGEAPTPTVTPEPARAEIVVTLLACPPGETLAGAGSDELVDACTEPQDGIAFTLGDPGAPPLTASTGVSGPGAVRFYDLLPADYTLTPDLPDGLTSAAVSCRIDGGEPYQKTLSAGATTFVDVSGESIACDWFVTRPAPPPQGPSGSITVREFLCEEDAGEIDDWERECAAGSTGATFAVASIDGAISLTAATNGKGVATFSALADGFYTLKQGGGAWCKARAERVDSQSRVIVEDGQNTDVFVYQCAAVTDLPSTGAGPGIAPMDGPPWWAGISRAHATLMAIGVVGAMVLLGWVAAGRKSPGTPGG